MGISNQSQGLRSGVCTSTTRPSAPYEGQMIYETDTNRVLVYDSAAWVMVADTDSPPGLELIKTQTIGSSVASVQVTDIFSSTYDNYLITINNCQVTGGQFWLRVGSKTTNYYWQLSYGSWTNSPSALGSSTDTYWKYVGSEGQGKIDVFIPISGPFLSSPTRIGPCSYADAGAGGVMMGYDHTNTSHTSFTLYNSLGNLTGGTIRVYGYRNSI